MKGTSRLLLIPILSGACALGWSITFTGVSGNLSAQASFLVSGSQLSVILTNTSLSDVLVPTDVLTAVFFNVSGTPLNLTQSSAVLTSGSSVEFGTTDSDGVVGGEWGYRGNIGASEFTSNGATFARSYGISSTGLGLYGPGNRFAGNNLQGPTSLDGLQYGITSAGDNLATGNKPVTGDYALIKNSVTFTFTGLPSGFKESSIKDVEFLYGTALNEPHFGPPAVPGPATIIPFGTGLLWMLLQRRKRRR
jgi:hypothetical protein